MFRIGVWEFLRQDPFHVPESLDVVNKRWGRGSLFVFGDEGSLGLTRFSYKDNMFPSKSSHEDLFRGSMGRCDVGDSRQRLTTSMVRRRLFNGLSRCK